MPAVPVLAKGNDEAPMLKEWNGVESCPENGTPVILLSNITCGAIQCKMLPASRIEFVRP